MHAVQFGETGGRVSTEPGLVIHFWLLLRVFLRVNLTLLLIPD